MSERKATVERNTKETQIKVSLVLEGQGKSKLDIGIPFLEHMLEQIARHGLFDLEIKAKGDLEIDAHHTVEDVGRALGVAVKDCVGDRRGIRRYGHSILPMDESLVTAAVDLGGRAATVLAVEYPVPVIGTFDVQLVEVFWESFAATAGANVHAVLHHGSNAHHIAEAVFKATARSLRMAVEQDSRQPGVPSTKGVLTDE